MEVSIETSMAYLTGFCSEYCQTCGGRNYKDCAAAAIFINASNIRDAGGWGQGGHVNPKFWDIS